MDIIIIVALGALIVFIIWQGGRRLQNAAF